MKNVESEIAKSETEWLKDRYEHTGFFESIGLLLRAIKREAEYRVSRGVQTVRQGKGPQVFHPKYDGKKTNIVISLTSTDKRLRYIIPALNSLISQTRRADLIILWLGKGKAYPRKAISFIKKMGIAIKYREDLGPHTKYFYAFREYKDDLVITVDDDIIYHDKMVEELVGAYLENRDKVIARRVHKMRFGADRNPIKYMDWIWEYKDSDGPSSDLFATGVGGVLYPPEIMSLKVWENKDFLKVCPRADDIWLKFCELSNGVKVCPVNDSAYYYDVIIEKSQKYGLSKANIPGGGNDFQLEKCAEYFGIKDDLCEMIING